MANSVRVTLGPVSGAAPPPALCRSRPTNTTAVAARTSAITAATTAAALAPKGASDGGDAEGGAGGGGVAGGGSSGSGPGSGAERGGSVVCTAGSVLLGYAQGPSAEPTVRRRSAAGQGRRTGPGKDLGPACRPGGRRLNL